MRKKKTSTSEKSIFENEFDRLKAEQALARARQNLIESNKILAEGAARLRRMLEKDNESTDEERKEEVIKNSMFYNQSIKSERYRNLVLEGKIGWHKRLYSFIDRHQQ